MPTSPIDKAMKKFESQNGTKIKDLTTKELVLILHKELSKKIDKHIGWGESEDRRLTKALSEHDKIIQHIVDTLPEKGWCDKVNTALFPDLPDLPLAYKSNVMWNDWRWIKRIFWIMIIIGGTTVFNLIIQLIG